MKKMIAMLLVLLLLICSCSNAPDIDLGGNAENGGSNTDGQNGGSNTDGQNGGSNTDGQNNGSHTGGITGKLGFSTTGVRSISVGTVRTGNGSTRGIGDYDDILISHAENGDMKPFSFIDEDGDACTFRITEFKALSDHVFIINYDSYTVSDREPDFIRDDDDDILPELDDPEDTETVYEQGTLLVDTERNRAAFLGEKSGLPPFEMYYLYFSGRDLYLMSKGSALYKVDINAEKLEAVPLTNDKYFETINIEGATSNAVLVSGIEPGQYPFSYYFIDPEAKLFREEFIITDITRKMVKIGDEFWHLELNPIDEANNPQAYGTGLRLNAERYTFGGESMIPTKTAVNPIDIQFEYFSSKSGCDDLLYIAETDNEGVYDICYYIYQSNMSGATHIVHAILDTNGEGTLTLGNIYDCGSYIDFGIKRSRMAESQPKESVKTIYYDVDKSSSAPKIISINVETGKKDSVVLEGKRLASNVLNKVGPQVMVCLQDTPTTVGTYVLDAYDLSKPMKKISAEKMEVIPLVELKLN